MIKAGYVLGRSATGSTAVFGWCLQNALRDASKPHFDFLRQANASLPPAPGTQA